MPSWSDVLREIQSGYSVDITRRKYLQSLQEYRNRNVICYYSGWLQKPQSNPYNMMINDSDIHAFMSVLKGLDKSKGLDLILHTLGGGIEATEKIVQYLRDFFGKDIEVFVPQLAQSAGTMIACSSKLIHMGKHSSLGAIDPQIGGLPAYSIRKSFQTAIEDIKKQPQHSNIWPILFQKYDPTLIVHADKAIQFTNKLVKDWIKTGMLFESEDSDEDKEKEAENIVKELGEKMSEDSFHNRHIGIKKCREKGLYVKELESDNKLQDLVLSIHHACILTFSNTPAIKIVENHTGIAHILT